MLSSYFAEYLNINNVLLCIWEKNILNQIPCSLSLRPPPAYPSFIVICIVAILHFNLTLPFIYLHLLPECFFKLNSFRCFLFSIWWMFITIIDCSEKCAPSYIIIALHYPWSVNHFTVINWICYLGIKSMERKGKGI